MLKVQKIAASYGQVRALNDVSLEVGERQIVTLLGANGAGKTSTLRVISGVLRPSAGSVELFGESIARRPPERIVSMGIVHVPEGRELFATLSVLENLRAGAFSRRDRAVERDIELVFSYFPILKSRRSQQAGSLSGGEQQMLAIGRGIMARPKLLLLDEPSLGLAPQIVQEIFRIIKAINEEEGVAILLVEQNAAMALRIAHYGYVLETGNTVLAAPATKLEEDDSVRHAYLGY